MKCYQIIKIFPPKRISLAKLTACCIPFPGVIHSLKQCFSRFLPLSLRFRSMDVLFWSLPRACRTGILHQVAGMHRIYNMVIIRSSKLLMSALKSKSPVLFDVFTHSSTLAFTSLGYNCVAPILVCFTYTITIIIYLWVLNILIFT